MNNDQLNMPIYNLDIAILQDYIALISTHIIKMQEYMDYLLYCYTHIIEQLHKLNETKKMLRRDTVTVVSLHEYRNIYSEIKRLTYQRKLVSSVMRANQTGLQHQRKQLAALRQLLRMLIDNDNLKCGHING